MRSSSAASGQSCQENARRFKFCCRSLHLRSSVRSTHEVRHGPRHDPPGSLRSGGGGGGDDGPDPTGAPTDAAELFGDPTSGTPTGGPCLAEPEIGTLYPRNWLRPRFSWLAIGGQNLFEIRVVTPNEVNQLVVYTTATTWTMPAAMWAGLSVHIIDEPINNHTPAWDNFDIPVE